MKLERAVKRCSQNCIEIRATAPVADHSHSYCSHSERSLGISNSRDVSTSPDTATSRPKDPNHHQPTSPLLRPCAPLTDHPYALPPRLPLSPTPPPPPPLPPP